MHVVTPLGNAWDSFTVGGACRKIPPDYSQWLFYFAFFYAWAFEVGEVTMIFYEAIIAITVYNIHIHGCMHIICNVVILFSSNGTMYIIYIT